MWSVRGSHGPNIPIPCTAPQLNKSTRLSDDNDDRQDTTSTMTRIGTSGRHNSLFLMPAGTRITSNNVPVYFVLTRQSISSIHLSPSLVALRCFLTRCCFSRGLYRIVLAPSPVPHILYRSAAIGFNIRTLQWRKYENLDD